MKESLITRIFGALSRHNRRTLLAILATAALIHLGLLLQYRSCPMFDVALIDEASYVKWAENLARGALAGGDQPYYQDPLYPYFLGGLFALTGESKTAARIVQALLNILSLLLIYLIAREMFGVGAALLAAALAMFYGVFYFFSALLLKATLSLVTVEAALLLLLKARRTPGTAKLLLSGLLLGLAALVRANVLLFVPVAALLAYLTLRERPRLRRLADSGLLLLGTLLAIAPVTIRNGVVSGEFVLTTSQLGQNFYIGNNKKASGRYKTLPFVRANPEHEGKDFLKEAEKRAGRKLTATGASSFWFNETWKEIGEDFTGWLKRLLRKTLIYFNSYEMPDNYNYYYLREHYTPILYLAFLPFGLILLLAALGMVASWKDRRRLAPAYLFIIMYTLSVIAFFVVSRYRLPVMPPLFAFAGFGILEIVRRIRERDSRHLAWLALALAVLALIAFRKLDMVPDNYHQERFLTGNAYFKLGKLSKAERLLKEAIKLKPNYLPAMQSLSLIQRRLAGPREKALLKRIGQKGENAADLFELGKTYGKIPNLKRALEAYRRVLQHKPRHAGALLQLGMIHATQRPVLDLVKAERYLRRAIEADSLKGDAYNALGNVLLLSGRLRKALETWRQGLVSQPGHRGILHNLKASSQGARDDRAFGLKPRLNTAPKGPPLKILIGQVRDRPTANNLFALANGYNQRGLVKQAIAAYYSILKTDPSHAGAHLQLGILFGGHKAVRKLSLAHKHLLASVKLSPGNAHAYNALGNVLFLMGDRLGAEGAWRKGLAIAPGHQGLRHNLRSFIKTRRP